jgi:hypothetical protein
MKKILFSIVILLAAQTAIFAQKEKDDKISGPAETGLNFTCTSTSGDSIQLKAVITVKHEEGATLLANAHVKFSVAAIEGDIPLGDAKTDFRGIAIIMVPSHNKFVRNDEQLIQFKASFEGNQKFASAESEFSLKPAKLIVSFYEEDSVRYVKVTATQVNADGTDTPLGPADVTVSVPKMFSLLKIASVSLDSTGIGNAEFPKDIIGDSIGNLIVIASIDENDVYGNVVGKSEIKWGLPKHLISPDRPSRELWTPIAPLWMIITLIVMLAGVWGHYLYAVIQLVMIKKSGIAKKAKEEEAEAEVS